MSVTTFVLNESGEKSDIQGEHWQIMINVLEDFFTVDY
jgi:hypothetical protein